MIATDELFKNKHKGEECLILGGGYREKIDHGHNIINPYEYKRCALLDKYKYTVFGCNTAYKVRDLDYIVVKDPWVYEEQKEEYKKLKSAVFYVGADEESDLYISVKTSPRPFAGISFDDGILSCLGGYAALHIALLMGFKRILLSGFLGGNTCIGILSTNFIFFTEWISKYNRGIYVTDKNSILKTYFKYERLRLGD